MLADGADRCWSNVLTVVEVGFLSYHHSANMLLLQDQACIAMPPHETTLESIARTTIFIFTALLVLPDADKSRHQDTDDRSEMLGLVGDAAAAVFI